FDITTGEQLVEERINEQRDQQVAWSFPSEGGLIWLGRTFPEKLPVIRDPETLQPTEDSLSGNLQG
ncbi:MAG: hypothetical protein AAF202_11005, partial [Pseudomonadota bacterium]